MVMDRSTFLIETIGLGYLRHELSSIHSLQVSAILLHKQHHQRYPV